MKIYHSANDAKNTVTQRTSATKHQGALNAASNILRGTVANHHKLNQNVHTAEKTILRTIADVKSTKKF